LRWRVQALARGFSLLFTHGRRAVVARWNELLSPKLALSTFDALATMPGVNAAVAVEGTHFTPSQIAAVFDTGETAQPIACASQAIPPVRVFEIPNVTIIGRSDAILVGDSVIGNGTFSMPRCLVCEERHGLLRVRGDRVSVLASRRAQRHQIDSALCLVGTGAGNWAHWLTEILPRAVLLGREQRWRSMPAIVDADMPETMLASLRAALGYDRQLIYASRGEVITVKHGVVASPSAQVPYEYRAGCAMNYADVWFSPGAMRAVQKMALALDVASVQPAGGKRLFIKRSGGARALGGVEVLERGLAERDFVTIRPERMTFAEQVAAFRNADVIVSQTGAGLMNMMFARPGCDIVALTTLTKVSNYFYFSIVAEMLGHRMHYVFGQKEASHADDDPHQAFCIAPGGVLAAVDRVLGTANAEACLVRRES
jgi:capsular polysaccharide biosynthesis protein